MNLVFNFTGMACDPTLEHYAQNKLTRLLSKLSSAAIKAELTFSEVKIEKQVHLHLVSEKGHIFEVSTKNVSFECCIDKIHEMTRRQILREKERNFSKRRALFQSSYKKQGLA